MRRVLPGLLYGAIVAATLAAPAAAWTPSKFQLYCGQPHLRYGSPSLADEDQRASYQLYLGKLGTDIDIAGTPGCVHQGRTDLVEEWSSQILSSYQAMSFQSPSPNRLGPVVLDDAGERRNRIFAVEGTDAPKYASTRHPCRGGKMDPSILSVMRVNARLANVHPTPNFYRLFAHEFVHVLQNASDLRSGARTDDCELPHWLQEGTADALSVHLMNQRFVYRPPLSVRGSKSIYGLRPYDKAFTWLADSSVTDSFKFPVIPQYRASSFWMYLADRYFGGKYDYLARYHGQSDFEPGGDDWLDWLDRLLRADRGGIDSPLYLVFPDFVADYAEWGSKKYRHIGDEDWLADAFGGCHIVPLVNGTLPYVLELELEPISAQCLRVPIVGLSPGELATVKIVASDSSRDRLDELHLAAVRLGTPTTNLNRVFSCYDEHKVQSTSDLCTTMPFMGTKGEPKDAGGGVWVKTWLTDQQQAAKRPENIYMIVHTPVYPSDAKHANRMKQKVKLEIGLDTTRLTSSTGGSGKAAESAINSLKNTEPIPMTGGEGFGGMLAAGQGDAAAISKLPFMATMMMPDFGEMAGGGLAMVNVQQLGEGSSGTSTYDAEQIFTLYLEEPVPFGSTGSFPALVSGSTDPSFGAPGPGNGFANGISLQSLTAGVTSGVFNDGKQPSGTVTVHQFDDAMLKMSVRGRFCGGADYDFQSKRCRRTETFDAEITKPFGWAYDSSQKFHSFDTPGIAEYREHISKRMNQMSPGIMPVYRKQQDLLPGEVPDPGDPSAGGSGAGGGSKGGPVQQACDCTCKGQEQFKQDVEAAKGGPIGEMAGYLKCAMECAAQWSQCG